ncbi:tRNA-His guanylyltransferase [Cystobasidiomycetes sp. EMM_F5]
MANTRFGYVRQYELSDAILPNVFLVVRLDGKGFHRFADQHGFAKPNDRRALDLMNAAAKRTMESETLRQHIVLAFGESDEFSFLIPRRSDLFKRRESKILSTILSIFTASYVLLWSRYFDATSQLDPALEGPSFDARVVVYPSEKEIIDYFKWRQADTHINNLYNTTFWALIQQGGMSIKEAHACLSGSVSSQKHEILFSRFGINYNQLDVMFRKGSILMWEDDVATTTETNDKTALRHIAVAHDDMLKDSWWDEHRLAVLG